MTSPVKETAHLMAELPAGGRVPLRTQEEVDLWKESSKKYIDDYQLVQQNDLNLLGAILIQQIILFRQQHILAGMEAELDPHGVPTGRYISVSLSTTVQKNAQETLIKASDEIQKIEKSLGIDKKTRESGGQHTVQQYITRLKELSREYGIHLSERLLAYEGFNMDLRQRLRILRNADPEDRAYHGITEASICEFAEEELRKLEVIDKDFAVKRHAIYLGSV